MQRSSGNDESTSGNASAKGCDRLIQNRILTASGESREECGYRRAVCLIDSAAGNQLIDHILICSAQKLLRFGVHVEQSELSWNRQSKITSQCLFDLIDVYLQHHLRLAGVEVFQDACCSVEHRHWRAHGYLIRTRGRTHEADIEDRA